jgi:hypothetical protein
MAERRDIETRFKPLREKPLSKRMTAVRLPVEIDLAVQSLGTPSERAEWLRRVICEAAERELISKAN